MKCGFQLVILLLFTTLLGCNNANNRQYAGNPATRDTAASIITTAIDSNAIKFDLLEALFKNENWLLVQGQDTSFVYCSRLGKAYFKTYYYHMRNGDSTATVVSEIKLSGNTIVWQTPPVGSMLRLTAITATSTKWNDNNGNMYLFQKTDSSNIQLTCSGKEPLHLKRTITLSAFLVKSKYDQTHGTRLAYENIK